MFRSMVMEVVSCKSLIPSAVCPQSEQMVLLRRHRLCKIQTVEPMGV